MKNLHAPGPILLTSDPTLNRSPPAKKGAVPRWPSLTITLLFAFLIVCTIGVIIGSET